jgi:hypothetical protein
MYTKSNKEIYRFKVFLEQETDVDVDVEKEVEVEKKVEVEKTRKGKDGKTEKYTDTELKKVKEKQIVIESRKSVEKVEQIFVIKQPTRREMEEADMEYSIEMSKCVKKGVLTKAMLMNKYTDTGGMLSEKDAQELSKLYGKLGELQTDFTALNLKSQSKASESKKSEVSKDMAELRRTIATAETNFSALLNHTADTRAQNKVIVWYLLTLTNLEKDGKLESFFTGETFEEKKDHFYKMEEEEDELLEVVYDKITAFISFWYFSSSASESDFKDLEKDIEEGSL